MKHRIDIKLITLADGIRLLRLEHPESGLCLERRVLVDRPVLAQKTRLFRLFEQMLDTELAVA